MNAKHTQETLLENFINEYRHIKNQALYAQNPLYALIDKTRYALRLTSCLDASIADQLADITQSLQEPMKVAIIGQFSSGKSTFLNALLGEEILPSGITPITAKICEIVYGQTHKLEVIYKNGVKDTKPISYLQEVDEAQNAKISLFRLSAPLPLLQQIHFLDTPGFNSQNQSDTDTTNRVLENVDGIIWLTLIDNVGKQSEREILLSHIKRYAHKSLCILNQKDRFKNQDEVKVSLAYAQKAFEGIFGQVIAISAKQALCAHNASSEAQRAQLREDSGIDLVLEFIHSHIIPTAQKAKSHTTCLKLRALLYPPTKSLMHARLQLIALRHKIEHHHQLLVEQSEQSAFFKAFPTLFHTFESLLNTLARHIFDALEKQDEDFTRQEKRFGFSTQTTERKSIFTLPQERITLKLNNPDSQIYRDFLKFGYELEKMGDLFADFIDKQTQAFADRLKQWHSSYATDSSGLEGEIAQSGFLFQIFNEFERLATEHSSQMHAQLTLYRQILILNYPLALALCLTHIHSKIFDSLDKHRKDPDTFPLFIPTFAHILDELKMGFRFEFLQENLLTQPLHKKAIWDLQRQTLALCKLKQTLISSWIESKSKALRTLQSCAREIKAFQHTSATPSSNNLLESHKD